MIAVRTNAADVSKALAEIAREHPRETRKGLVTFAIAMVGESKHLIKTGRGSKTSLIMGFRPIAALTKALRRSRRAVYGGKLNASIRSYARGDTNFIGWPDALEPHGRIFQTAEARPFSNKERRRFYQADIQLSLFGGHKYTRKNSRKKANRGEQQVRYDRPVRDVWGKIANSQAIKDYMLKVVRGRVQAILEKRAKGVKRT